MTFLCTSTCVNRFRLCPRHIKTLQTSLGLQQSAGIATKCDFWQRMQDLKLTCTLHASFTSCGHWFVTKGCMHANVSLMEISCQKWGHCMKKNKHYQAKRLKSLTKWHLNNRPDCCGMCWCGPSVNFKLRHLPQSLNYFTFVASLTLLFIRPLTTSTELLLETCFMAGLYFCFCGWGRLFYDAFYVDCFYAVSMNYGVQYIKPARPLK